MFPVLVDSFEVFRKPCPRLHTDLMTQTNDEEQPKSRLARLAEDWLEAEEVDEWDQYWQRYDDNKNDPGSVKIESEEALFEDDENLSTEERLERYLQSRGISKAEEEAHRSEIEEALSKAQQASTPKQALDYLRQVQPYLQWGTQLGGKAWIEFAVATWQDAREDEALAILEELDRQNKPLRGQIRQLIRNGCPPARASSQSFWKNLFEGGFDGSSW